MLTEKETEYISSMITIAMKAAFELGHSKARQGFLLYGEHMEHCQPYIDNLVDSTNSEIKLGLDRAAGVNDERC